MAGKSFAIELIGLPAVLSRLPVSIDQLPTGLSKRFELLGMGDMDIDFAGRSKDPALHQAISNLRIGDQLLVAEPLQGERRRVIRTLDGQIVGRTSQAFIPPPGRISIARVATICVRRLQDVSDEWQSHMALAEWEVVLPELVIEYE